MITILTTTTADAAMTKQLTRTDTGWQKTDYARAYEFDVLAHDVRDLADLSDVLTMLEGEPRSCVIRGKLIDGMPTTGVARLKHPDEVSLRPAYFEENPEGVSWLMLDFDKVPAPAGLTDNRDRLDFLTAMLPAWFQDVSYHYQWSASAGLDGWQTLSAHLWFWLSEPWKDSLIIERIELEAWDVDEAPIRTVQPNFTADPIFTNCADPLAGIRSGVIVKDAVEVNLPPFVRPKPIFRPGAAPMPKGKSFEQRLSEIGPRFHMPINRAIACYVAVHGIGCDTWALKDALRDAINMAPGGSSPKSIYLKDHYLDQSIRGAMRKFGRII